MTGIAAPKRIRAVSRTGRPKAGYIFRLLRIKGYEPFTATDGAYAQERVRHEDGTWTDVSLTTDLRGVPIQRQLVGGVLQDVTWWSSKPGSWACTRCTIADGRVRQIIRTTRTAQHRNHDRVPTVQTAGAWHLDCLKVKLSKLGRFGHDQKQQATAVRVSK